MENKIVIATHSGMFHPDDVFAVATLLSILESSPVTPRVSRTRDETQIDRADFAVDVGGRSEPEKNRFDHHQEGGAGKRPNGIAYGSFGLVWRKFGEKLAGSAESALWIEKRLVVPIDAADNGQDLSLEIIPGVSPYLVDDFIYGLRPTWLEGAELIDQRFSEAVSAARRILEREIKNAEAALLGKKKVIGSYEQSPDKRIIVMDNFYPWREVLSALPEPRFAVFPREDDGDWNAKAVPQELSYFRNRAVFPESWAGKRDTELAHLSGVPDALFCHSGRFMAVAKSKEGAVALAKKALE